MQLKLIKLSLFTLRYFGIKIIDQVNVLFCLIELRRLPIGTHSKLSYNYIG